LTNPTRAKIAMCVDNVLCGPNAKPPNSIGVGRDDWFHPPLPPNRTCGSPDIRLSSRWSFLLRGLADQFMGCCKHFNPHLAKFPLTPVSEGCQHPCRPIRWFGPRPVTLKCCHHWVLSEKVSRFRHSLIGVCPAVWLSTGSREPVVVTSPPSCTPLLPQSYPGSSLLWVL